MATSRQKQNHRTDASPTSVNESIETPQVTAEEIAELAYALYLARGAEDGHDVEDWLQAERDLKTGVHRPALTDDGSIN